MGILCGPGKQGASKRPGARPGGQEPEASVSLSQVSTWLPEMPGVHLQLWFMLAVSPPSTVALIYLFPNYFSIFIEVLIWLRVKNPPAKQEIWV